mmetsp:Transcript_104200/g.179574  ORF Transcript_104200/g.179574 Transcript_104200/m.179574 type:complete len:298 (-) Transcript_104200:1022-1915(-)
MQLVALGAHLVLADAGLVQNQPVLQLLGPCCLVLGLLLLRRLLVGLELLQLRRHTLTYTAVRRGQAWACEACKEVLQLSLAAGHQLPSLLRGHGLRQQQPAILCVLPQKLHFAGHLLSLQIGGRQGVLQHSDVPDQLLQFLLLLVSLSRVLVKTFLPLFQLLVPPNLHLGVGRHLLIETRLECRDLDGVLVLRRGQDLGRLRFCILPQAGRCACLTILLFPLDGHHPFLLLRFDVRNLILLPIYAGFVVVYDVRNVQLILEARNVLLQPPLLAVNVPAQRADAPRGRHSGNALPHDQ